MMIKQMITVLMFGVGLSGGTVKAVVNENKACINNLRLIEAAKDQWAIENNLPTGAVVQAEEISDYIRGGIASIKCPANGVYTFGVIDDEPFCSIHGTMYGVMKRGRGLTTQEMYGREPVSEDEMALDGVLVEMSLKQGGFDPANLNRKGAEGMRQLADRLFPQSSSMGGADISREVFQQWISDLGAGDFQQREEAEKRLTQAKGIYRGELELAARGTDPEVKRRAQEVLRIWGAENESKVPVDYAQYLEAFKIYVAGIEDAQVLQELQVRAREAKEVGAVSGGQLKLMDACLDAGEK